MAGTTEARILPMNSVPSLEGVYSSASIVLRSRSPTNESAPMMDENMSGMIRNMGANRKAVM